MAENSPWTESERSLAKTLMIATGSADRARKLLTTIWGGEADETGEVAAPSRVPSPRSLSNWKNDPRIPVDEQMLSEWATRSRIVALTTAERLAGRMEKALTTAVKRYEEGEGTALDVLNLTKSYGILDDKRNGRHANAPGSVAPTSIHVGQGGTVQMIAYGPKVES